MNIYDRLKFKTLKEDRKKQMIVEMHNILYSMEFDTIEKKGEQLVEYMLKNRWYYPRWRVSLSKKKI